VGTPPHPRQGDPAPLLSLGCPSSFALGLQDCSELVSRGNGCVASAANFSPHATEPSPTPSAPGDRCYALKVEGECIGLVHGSNLNVILIA
jgi:hypothetical protein